MVDSLKSVKDSIQSNRLRSILTIAIIATGIMSLVGVETSIEVLSERIAGSFYKMGTGLYTVCSKDNCPEVTYRQASIFVTHCKDAVASIHATVLTDVRVKSSDVTTDPVVSVIAVDDNYMDCQSYSLAAGRFFSDADMEQASGVAVLGDNVRKKLFGDKAPLGTSVSVSGNRYRVIGYAERQGAVFGTGMDDSILLPVTCARGTLMDENDPVEITVHPSPDIDFMESVTESKALMRSTRRLRSTDDTDFQILRSNSTQANFLSVKRKLSFVALGIGLITLLGAAVGLMNIMLVSVKERRREIGIRKAIGAGSIAIERQFLAESVAIGQIGCLVGILAGLAAGNIVAVIMDGKFTVPWSWLVVSVFLAFLVSILSGLLPARRAASLDPALTLHE